MNVELFLQTLPIMGKGLLGIFLVTLVIIAVITLLNRFTNISKKAEQENE